MCGIIGYTGSEDAVTRITDGLRALEYRGYDSAGLAVWQKDGIRTVKTEGKVAALAKESEEAALTACCGIGHTRWATHGAPTAENAHPHRAPGVTLVHNGIIENEEEWRIRLTAEGYRFESQTDTEVAAAVISRCLSETGEPLAALKKAQTLLKGSYAFGVLFDCCPGVVYAVRCQSPLLVALGEDGNYLASDLPAVLKYTRRYFLLEENEIAVLTKDAVSVFGADGSEVTKEVLTAEWDFAAAEKGNWPHFMLKEIFEQPEALRRTVLPRIRDGLPYLDAEGLSDGVLAGVRQLRVVACGTAMHAGMVGKHWIESLARIPVTVDIASEFRYQNPIFRNGDLAVFVSQSGETADTLAALRLAKQQGVLTLGIVNVKGSAVSREADFVLYTHAGPEIAVASTKAYTVQMAAFALLALRLALIRNTCPKEQIKDLTACLTQTVPEQIGKALTKEDSFRQAAERLSRAEDLFFLGRGVDYVLSMEGSLKLKEISYIHSEAYAAGELKHGTISLVTEGTPVIVTATDPNLYEKTVSNLKEVAARGAKVILLRAPGLPDVPEAVQTIELPELPAAFAPFASAAVLQQIAYRTAVLRGCDVDQPRNLAKSVTVE